jgi:acyl-CoA synthetase (AMP-forming)/AMP-acid ligase II
VTEDEKNTKETVDAEGWIHTGDVAEIDSCGRIKIVDRVKVSVVCQESLWFLLIVTWTEHHEAIPG